MTVLAKRDRRLCYVRTKAPKQCLIYSYYVASVINDSRIKSVHKKQKKCKESFMF